jgi:hypothetical protein
MKEKIKCLLCGKIFVLDLEKTEGKTFSCCLECTKEKKKKVKK